MANSNLAPAMEVTPRSDEVGSGPSTMSVSASAFSSSLTIPFYFSVGRTTVEFNFWRNVRLANHFAAFESVVLEDLKFHFYVPPGLGNFLSFGVYEGTPPEDLYVGYWPVYQRYAAAQYGEVSALWELPLDWSFGRELKGVTVGNYSPHFYFSVGRDGGAGTITAIVRGHLRVRVSGHGVIPAVSFDPAQGNNASLSLGSASSAARPQSLLRSKDPQ